MRVASTASISRVASASPTSRGGSVLNVGPRSAGADPGPACYGKGGTEPTVTDANVVLGRVGHRPLGGAIRLDPERARVAVADLATRLGIADVATMAEGIVRLVVAEMANAIREISIERGYDPARFTLVPFGGAGPMHATRIAAELGMRRVLVPLDPGNLSALGLLVSDQRREHVRTFLAPLANLDLDAVVAALGEQERAGRAEMQASGEEVLEVRFAHALDMRYARQGFELTVDLAGAPSEPDDVRRAFLEAYARQYGHAHASGDIEIVNLRTTVIGVTPKPRVRRLRHGGRMADATLSRARHGRGREVHSGFGLRARAPSGGRGVRGARRHRGGGSDHGDAARMAGAPRRHRKPAFRGGGLSGGPDDRRSHGNAGSGQMTGPERARRRTRFDPIAPPTRRGEVLGESLGMRSAVQETIHEIAAGSGSGDSPENDGASLVRAPIRAAYSFADPDRAVIFPIRVEALGLSVTGPRGCWASRIPRCPRFSTSARVSRLKWRSGSRSHSACRWIR